MILFIKSAVAALLIAGLVAGCASKPPADPSKLSTDDVNSLMEQVKQKDGQDKIPFIKKLGDGKASAAAAVGLLEETLNDRDEYVMKESGLALARIAPKDPSVAATISKFLKGDSRWRKQDALEVLAVMSIEVTEPYIPDFIELLSADYHGTREDAAIALKAFGPKAKGAVTALERAITEPLTDSLYQNDRYYKHVCIAASAALKAIDPEEAAKFIPTVKNECAPWLDINNN